MVSPIKKPGTSKPGQGSGRGGRPGGSDRGGSGQGSGGSPGHPQSPPPPKQKLCAQPTGTAEPDAAQRDPPAPFRTGSPVIPFRARAASARTARA